mmetsp:Transcript_20392/g.38638  ORF Transcript_20392/g.38638 Transcript_20392/m.38638 type:complete len:257 (+) Transcript_20392:202-972(+)
MQGTTDTVTAIVASCRYLFQIGRHEQPHGRYSSLLWGPRSGGPERHICLNPPGRDAVDDQVRLFPGQQDGIRIDKGLGKAVLVVRLVFLGNAIQFGKTVFCSGDGPRLCQFEVQFVLWVQYFIEFGSTGRSHVDDSTSRFLQVLFKGLKDSFGTKVIDIYHILQGPLHNTGIIDNSVQWRRHCSGRLGDTCITRGIDAYQFQSILAQAWTQLFLNICDSLLASFDVTRSQQDVHVVIFLQETLANCLANPFITSRY